VVALFTVHAVAGYPTITRAKHPPSGARIQLGRDI
jgi:hypothetical protein